MKNLLSILSSIVLVAVPAIAQDYAIKLQTPLKVDQRYKTTVTRQDIDQRILTAPGQPPKTEKVEVRFEFESEATVLAVDASGRPTKESHVVEKLILTRNATKDVLIPRGRKLIATAQGFSTAFEVDGKPADSGLTKILEEVARLKSAGATEDEIYGTSERKKVGDSWNLNREKALKDLRDDPGFKETAIQSIDGKITLEKVIKSGDGDVKHFVVAIDTVLKPAITNLTDATLRMQMNVNVAIPSDLSKNFKVDTGTRTLTLKATGKPDPNGPTVQIDSVSKSTQTIKTKLLN